MKTNLASVVIPVFNYGRFLGEAIESVLAQTYTPVELIVVDDGSEDDSAEVARRYSQVTLLRQENQGPAAARNAGLTHSCGAFVGFLDADDIMLPGKLETQIAHLEQHHEIDVLMARMEVLLEPGMQMPRWLPVDRVYGDVGGVSPGSSVFRREVLERVGGLNADYRHCEFIEMLGRMREANATISVLPEVVFRYRVHGSNASQASDKMQEASFRALKERLDRRRQSAESSK